MGEEKVKVQSIAGSHRKLVRQLRHLLMTSLSPLSPIKILSHDGQSLTVSELILRHPEQDKDGQSVPTKPPELVIVVSPVTSTERKPNGSTPEKESATEPLPSFSDEESKSISIPEKKINLTVERVPNSGDQGG